MRSLVFCIVAAGACVARTITVSGTVMDTSGTGVAGATVKLEQALVSVTTDAGGRFMLTGDVGVHNDNRRFALPDAGSVTCFAATISFTLKVRSNVALELIDATGRVVVTERRVEDPGAHSLSIPALVNGLYLFRMVLGNAGFRFSGVVLGTSILFSKPPYGGNRTGSRSEKRAESEVPTDDLLTVTGEGLLDYRIAIRSPEVHGIAVTMLPNAGDVVDADGNAYQSVRIGSQIWTVENLKTTTCNDGTPITHVPDSAAWLDIYLSSSPVPAYCIYNDSVASGAKYGVFYNWYAVGTGKLAPVGWRVPSDADWDTLQNYLITHGYNYDGSMAENRIAKSMAAQWGWESSTIEGAVGNDLRTNNASGFSALPGGLRHWGGSFYSILYEKSVCYLWSSTELDSLTALHRHLDAHRDYLNPFLHHKNTAFPVRILRDAE